MTDTTTTPKPAKVGNTREGSLPNRLLHLEVGQCESMAVVLQMKKATTIALSETAAHLRNVLGAAMRRAEEANPRADYEVYCGHYTTRHDSIIVSAAITRVK